MQPSALTRRLSVKGAAIELLGHQVIQNLPLVPYHPGQRCGPHQQGSPCIIALVPTVNEILILRPIRIDDGVNLALGMVPLTQFLVGPLRFVPPACLRF
jgi:hypothetical protein